MCVFVCVYLAMHESVVVWRKIINNIAGYLIYYLTYYFCEYTQDSKYYATFVLYSTVPGNFTDDRINCAILFHSNGSLSHVSLEMEVSNSNGVEHKKHGIQYRLTVYVLCLSQQAYY